MAMAVVITNVAALAVARYFMFIVTFVFGPSSLLLPICVS